MEEAFETANQMVWTEEELEYYEAKSIYIQDERGRIEYAINQGRIEGEKNKASEMAKNMLSDNFDTKIISKYTGLLLEDIEKLKKE